ncbi:MAG: HAD-IIIC family phosphatase [Lachnospiraceae bacterium]|nr:HAD-IIIC family phosphatase [Lachnospiraceae bacterium]
MASFLKLKKNLKKDMSGLPEYRFAVTGDCATQHLATALRGQAYEYGMDLVLFDADYDEIRAQLMDPDSELYGHRPEAILIDMCTEKLYEAYCMTAMEERCDFADRKMEEIRGYWDHIRSNAGGAKIIQFNFPESDDRIFGNYANSVESSFLFQVRKLNLLLMQNAASDTGVFICDLNVLKAKYGDSAFKDNKMYYAARLPYSTEMLVYISDEVMKIINALRAKIKKCVVLDLDNTLWGGVIGDDGLEGIEIGELGIGRAFRDFQLWLKELTKRGIILAVCSKNDEDKAKEPFEKHPDMVLRLDDIACFIANWEDKASNIRKIREILNLGMDSFVFLDDNPFERNLVKSMIPEITVPELPEDPAEYLAYLKGLDLFETISFVADDGVRTKQYQAEAKRVKSQAAFSDYKDYLKDLEMEAYAGPFDTFHYPRIAELSQRSNQFNLRTVRYTADEIKALAGDPSYITLYFTLKDKFGDHGLISVAVIKKEADSAFVENWFMSCRVLKRTMEEYIINSMVNAVKEAGIGKLKAEYIPSAKNAMVKDIYSRMGFEDLGEGKYLCDVNSFVMRETYVS